jgi:hypothetical protein
MPALSAVQPQARDITIRLSKRENWASHEAGVIVVFCIVFLVAVGVAYICVSKALARRRARRPVAH